MCLNVSAYYSTIAEGTILILAVLAGSLSPELRPCQPAAPGNCPIWGVAQSRLPVQLDRTDRRLRIASRAAGPGVPEPAPPPFYLRNAEALRYALPAYICLVAIVVVTQVWLGNAIFNTVYWNSLLVLSSFLAVLALGQGTVILTGGLIFLAMDGWHLRHRAGRHGKRLRCCARLCVADRADDAVAIGFADGVGIVYLGISPIVMTLATNGILQGFALLYSHGTPAIFLARVALVHDRPALRDDACRRLPGGIRRRCGAAAWPHQPSAAGSTASATASSRHALRHIDRKDADLVYILSALCSAFVGIMLTGFSGQASLGMGDDYLLPSIAVVVVGGALITGGRGHYLGMLGGVLLLTALQMLLRRHGLTLRDTRHPLWRRGPWRRDRPARPLIAFGSTINLDRLTQTPCRGDTVASTSSMGRDHQRRERISTSSKPA